jgi:ribosomal protein S20
MRHRRTGASRTRLRNLPQDFREEGAHRFRRGCACGFGGCKQLDKAAPRGIIHKNQAARRKSRLMSAAAKSA